MKTTGFESGTSFKPTASLLGNFEQNHPFLHKYADIVDSSAEPFQLKADLVMHHWREDILRRHGRSWLKDVFFNKFFISIYSSNFWIYFVVFQNFCMKTSRYCCCSRCCCDSYLAASHYSTGCGLNKTNLHKYLSFLYFIISNIKCLSRSTASAWMCRCGSCIAALRSKCRLWPQKMHYQQLLSVSFLFYLKFQLILPFS